ncbi:MAG: DUF1648 domain-containing protein [candidate division KSB1 bacterium]|nr:DUF1648 domain-containing protein [candidate division KSB1 bacterium]MDZ7366454.1 DUF1648 domain-containing protein [candidate division KSB1 bacterium]MDZ7404584.1 DUF1648 domain-containing protein [candidate division KSB1 bacterium]
MLKTTFTKSGSRPVLQIPKSSLELGLETTAALGLLIMLYFTFTSWPLLPETIPHHFDISGKPDAWGGKWTLSLLPGIGLVLYVGLTILSRYPHIYNYLWPITEKNAAAQYHLARTMIVALKAEISLLFAYLQQQTIQVALGKAEGLGVAFLPTFLVLIFGTIGIYFVKAYQAR